MFAGCLSNQSVLGSAGPSVSSVEAPLKPSLKAVTEFYVRMSEALVPKTRLQQHLNTVNTGSPS